MSEPMTLERFRKTGRDVLDLGVEHPGLDLDGQSGRVYEGGGYVELMPDGGWYLILGRSEYSAPLDQLEELLFDWCKTERFFDPPARQGVVINEAEWAQHCAMRDVTGHPADPRNSGRAG